MCFKIYNEPANKGYINKNFIKDTVFRGDDEISLQKERKRLAKVKLGHASPTAQEREL